jgi:quercetin dioxygenase-like cupin family protein
MGYRRGTLPELPSRPSELVEAAWKPVRHHFGIRAFGVNGYVAEAPGQLVIEVHSEDESGFEELYVVLAGVARFEVDGDSFDAPAGTLVYVEPESERGAWAKNAGTAVLAVGAVKGKAFTMSDWEQRLL